jgi:hypothetical protein
VKYFIDNTFALGLCRAAALIAGPDGHAFLRMLDLFKEDSRRRHRLHSAYRAAGRRLDILSGDRRLVRSPQNRQALVAARLPVFVMPSGFPDHHRWIQASKFFKYLPAIVKPSLKLKRGDFYDVQENAAVQKRD